MPAGDRNPTSPSPGGDEDEDQVLTRGNKSALSRRKTTALDERIDPALQSSHTSYNAGAPRQSMPSRPMNDLTTTPHSSHPGPQQQISGQNLTPKRTPVALVSTVEKRFDTIMESSNALLIFYQDYTERLAISPMDLPQGMDQQIKRLWRMFASARLDNTYPFKDNNDYFLDSTAVLEGNAVDSTSELALELNNKVAEANRATFIHLIAQLPFDNLSQEPTSEFSPLSVDKLGEHLQKNKHDPWPIRNIEELLTARTEFFKKIVPHRRKCLATLDDLYLFLDLCTQIAIYNMWKAMATKNQTTRQKQIDKQLGYVFSGSPFADAFGLGEATERLEKEYENLVKERLQRFKALNYQAMYVQKAFPLQVTAAVLINYINGLRTFSPIPLKEFDSGLAMPRSKEHIFSPALRDSFDKLLHSTTGSIEDIPGDAPEQIEEQVQDQDQDQDAEGEVEEELPATGRGGRLRFNKDYVLERVDDEQRPPSIFNRQGEVEAIRDTEFDVGDPDVFMEARTNRATAIRGKGKKRAGPKRKGKSSASKPSIREGDSDVEMPQASTKSSIPEGVEIDDDEMMPEAAAAAILAQTGLEVDGVEANEFEVGQEELQATQKESEDRREARQKRKRAEREDSEYLPPSAGPSTSHTTTQESGEEPRSPKEKKVKQERGTYRYATGGNQLGRVVWSEEEKHCLLNDLQELHPRYLEALNRGVRFTIWKEILKRHGTNGTVSMILQKRNNVQCKDKARNEFERRKRASEEIPEWLAPYG